MLYSSQISGTGSYLPSRCLSNYDLQKIVETTHEWIMERTGIETRHVAAPGEVTSDLAFQAARQALDSAGLTPHDIDAILVATVTPDQPMPSTACVLQAKLGCRSTMALDVSAACSGFLYALSVADQFIRTGMYRHVLVVGAETLSRIVNYEDRQTCILFGDGAGAVVLSRCSKESSSKIYSSHLHANGEAGDLLTIGAGGSRIPLSIEALNEKHHLIQMKGRDVFKAAVRVMSERCREALETNRMPVQDIQWYIFHQANMRIIDAVAEPLEIPPDRILNNIRHTGNTSSASIPLVLDKNVREGRIQRGENLLLAAFGGGLTSASVLLRY